MKKKIAMRWRRKALRKGAIFSNEHLVFSKAELRDNNLKNKHNGFGFTAEYNGWKWCICDEDMLSAYKFFALMMDDEI